MPEQKLIELLFDSFCCDLSFSRRGNSKDNLNRLKMILFEIPQTRRQKWEFILRELSFIQVWYDGSNRWRRRNNNIASECFLKMKNRCSPLFYVTTPHSTGESVHRIVPVLHLLHDSYVQPSTSSSSRAQYFVPIRKSLKWRYKFRHGMRATAGVM